MMECATRVGLFRWLEVDLSSIEKVTGTYNIIMFLYCGGWEGASGEEFSDR